jgi:hypothetical protein
VKTFSKKRFQVLSANDCLVAGRKKAAAGKAGGRGRRKRGGDEVDPGDPDRPSTEEQRRQVMQRLLQENYQEEVGPQGAALVTDTQATAPDTTVQGMETEEI